VRFLLSGIQLILIDLLLAGDNALVIAMAVRSLPPRERRWGIGIGAGLAVALRVGLTLVAVYLLTIPFLQLAGGLFVLWIAVKVMIDVSDPPDCAPCPTRLWQAVWYVVFADLTMSVDNILAIAGASRGNNWLIVFGLAVSIPFIVLSSNLLANLMDRYPFTIYLGAGILGQVGGSMILKDHWVAMRVHLTNLETYAIEATLVVLVLAAGWLLGRRRKQLMTAGGR
jgi:YjbE family integral membrane protein